MFHIKTGFPRDMVKSMNITGNATTANKLTSFAGDAYTPVYFSSSGYPISTVLSKVPVDPSSTQIGTYPSGAMWIES